MTVVVEDGIIFLRGRCPAEDAESLLVALQDEPDRTVDLGEAQRLHAAVLQILLAFEPRLRSRPSAPFLSEVVFAAGKFRIATD